MPTNERRQVREQLISAGLLALAKEMDRHGPQEFLSDANFENPELAMQVFADMMRQRDLWDAFNNGYQVKDPPPAKVDTESQFIFIPGHAYPDVAARPVRWKTTRIHFSQYAFKFEYLHETMETRCGLRIPQLAVIMPMSAWHPGSDETCKLCSSLGH